MSLHTKFILSVVPFLIIFFGLVLFLENEKQNGKEVTLHAVSRDPNDFFRGDYVTLRYDIGSYIPSVQPKNMFGYNKTKCLILNNNKPATIKEVVDVGEVAVGSLHLCADSYRIINYGYQFTFSNLEKFYVPNNKGWAIDEAAREGKLDVIVSITNRGIGYIKYLTIDGQKVDFSQIKEKR